MEGQKTEDKRQRLGGPHSGWRASAPASKSGWRASAPADWWRQSAATQICGHGGPPPRRRASFGAARRGRLAPPWAATSAVLPPTSLGLTSCRATPRLESVRQSNRRHGHPLTTPRRIRALCVRSCRRAHAADGPSPPSRARPPRRFPSAA